MIHRPRGHARTRCLVWSQQSPLEFFQYGSGRPCARVSRVLTKATSHLIALSLQPKEVGNDNRAEVKNDGFGCAPWKGGAFQWVQVPPGERSSRKQPEQLWR